MKHLGMFFSVTILRFKSVSYETSNFYSVVDEQVHILVDGSLIIDCVNRADTLDTCACMSLCRG